MIESNYFWTNILILSFVTLAIRFSFIAFSEKFKVTDKMRLIFSYIPAIVLPAMLVPAVFFHSGSSAIFFYKERFFITILAAAVCFYSKSNLLTITFGLLALYAVNIYLVN